MRNRFIKKVILSANPSTDHDYIAVALLNLTGKVAFCKNGDNSWTYIHAAQLYFEDVLYRNELLYAVNKMGQLAVFFDFHRLWPLFDNIPVSLDRGDDMLYLASSSMKDLFLITRHLNYVFVDQELGSGYRTTLFHVFRLNVRIQKWEKVMNLGHQMLFLGENSPLVLSSHDYPGCRGNCIYYTDDYCKYDYENLYAGHDSGIFHQEDNSIDQLLFYSNNFHSPNLWPPPVWVTPYPF